MAGIVSYGAYIPIYRLSRAILGQVWGGGGKGEKAIANWDEDSITMAVEAGMDCLTGMDKKSVDALYVATTTPPFKEKQSASIVTAALDLREDIVAADFGNSLRSGTLALKCALDAVKAGSAKQVLVIATDARIPAPNSAFEPLFGDGAAAFLIGADGVAAEIEASYYLTSEFIDIWRLEYDKLPRTWEERFTLDEGYEPHIKKAISALFRANNVTGNDFAKAAFYAPNARSHGNVAKAMGLNAQDPLFDSVGNTGAAFALMTLVGALEEANAGDKLLLGTYGDGADAHIISVGDGIAKLRDRRGIKKHLESKVMLENYGKYIKFRDLMQLEITPVTRPRTSLPAMWRDRNWQYRCHGHKCNNCGKVQFPFQKRCMYCQADSKFLEEVPLSHRKGVLVTFSMDERAAIVDPPNVLAAVNFDEGGRVFSQMTDRDVNTIDVGMRMEMTFRKIHDALGVHNYSWKVRPVRV